jgi:hypothetical protein
MNDIFDNFQQRPLDTLKNKIQIPIQGVFILIIFQSPVICLSVQTKTSKMSSSFLSEANKLKNIQMYLEKNDNLLHFSKYSSECDLSEYFVELEIAR